MQLIITYQKFVPLQRKARDSYIAMSPCYSIFAEDEQRNLFIFRSDGIEVSPNDLLFVHMRGEQSRNSYSYHAKKHSTKIMARPTILYGESGNATSKTAADVKRIRVVIGAVTTRPVSFPADDRDGLSVNKVTMTYQ